MRKIKTKGRKWTVKKVNNGPTYSVILHKTNATRRKTVDALVQLFDVSENLAEVAIKTTPIVLISDLSQQEASGYVKKLKGAGDFRVWLSSAASRMKKMSFKIREETLTTK